MQSWSEWDSNYLERSRGYVSPSSQYDLHHIFKQFDWQDITRFIIDLVRTKRSCRKQKKEKTSVWLVLNNCLDMMWLSALQWSHPQCLYFIHCCITRILKASKTKVSLFQIKFKNSFHVLGVWQDCTWQWRLQFRNFPQQQFSVILTGSSRPFPFCHWRGLARHHAWLLTSWQCALWFLLWC